MKLPETAVAAALSMLLVACAVNAVASGEAPRPAADEEDRVLAVLRAYAGDENSTPRLAWADLDADGRPEAIAMLAGNWCGTGGCTLVVLRRDGTSWNVVSRVPTSRPPVVTLPGTTQGWRDLAVTVAGGGESVPRQMVLTFGEGGYAKRPGVVAGERQDVLIPSP